MFIVSTTPNYLHPQHFFFCHKYSLPLSLSLSPAFLCLFPERWHAWWCWTFRLFFRSYYLLTVVFTYSPSLSLSLPLSCFFSVFLATCLLFYLLFFFLSLSSTPRTLQPFYVCIFLQQWSSDSEQFLSFFPFFSLSPSVSQETFKSVGKKRKKYKTRREREREKFTNS